MGKAWAWENAPFQQNPTKSNKIQQDLVFFYTAANTRVDTHRDNHSAPVGYLFRILLKPFGHKKVATHRPPSKIEDMFTDDCSSNAMDVDPFYATELANHHEIVSEGEQMRRHEDEAIKNERYGDYVEPISDSDTSGNDECPSDYGSDIDINQQGEDGAAETYLDFGSNEDYYPFSSKKVALCALLMNIPRHPISEGLLQLIWWWAREFGVVLPSIAKVEKELDAVMLKVGCQSRVGTTQEGDSVHINSVTSAVMQDVANPVVMRHLRTFSEDVESGISELCHSQRWKTDPCLRLPMVRHGGNSYFIGDFATADGTLLHIKRFFTRKGQLWLEGQKMRLDVSGYWITDIEVLRPVATLTSQLTPEFEERKLGGHELVGFKSSRRNKSRIYEDDERSSILSPHHLKIVIGNRRVIITPLILYCDDVSGNRSKKWNCHYNWCFQLAGLPFKYCQMDYNTHFIATSNCASPLDIGKLVVNDIRNGLERGVLAYDARLMEEVVVIGYTFCVEGDNPMHNELTSMIDIKNDLHQLLQLSMARSWRETKDTLDKQVVIAKTQGVTALQRNQRENGVKSTYATNLLTKLTSMRSQKLPLSDIDRHAALHIAQYGLNPLFDLVGFDGHEDSPVEALHTILLGTVKWLWRATIKHMARRPEKIVFAARLDSMATRGLDTTFKSKQLIQYSHSLIGKDFRAIAQVAPFLCRNLLSPEWTNAWMAMSELTAMIYTESIEDMETYLRALTQGIHVTIARMCDVDDDFFNKHKFHIILHFPESIRRFGPARLYASEKFEAYNPIMRGHSVHSNRQSPSKDIGQRFARYQTLRHVFSGGYWLEGWKRERVDFRWI
ncbi:uncharacterized protein EV422DRAFT_502697 [Fimicolochytrium jonesii]|uniref:uncharacterized protein n=1 Tax=Fimicolochytrium jonesii TaxID=1396493 RepID=UPI0022FDED0A|nr:uncharacterized protein EV422DRAFT_502697 [Fimicolochytrium jonesii]KAI8826980.1 hypothetical protein EV422DRAFT_502697 [Fimicolochytrium jonesii]